MNGLKRLGIIQKLNEDNPDWVNRDIFRILRKEDIWIAAYENIKGNKGALTPGVTNATLDGTSIDKLRNLQQQVLNESYKFKPVKQIMIPKANGKQRPLGLPTPNDKIVQEVIRMVLEAIYEPNFDERSFGFRKGKGVHDALDYVDSHFRWVDWVIKGDFRDAYPTIEHKKLCEIMEKKIQDPRMMRLIRKSLKGGVSMNPYTIYSKIGVPQGSIVSPILANIYFNEIDRWVTKKAKEVLREKSSKRNPEYRKLEYKIKKASEIAKDESQNPNERKKAVKEIKQYIQERNQTPSLLNRGVELKYTRYADDWIIGIKGSRKLACEIQVELEKFFQTQLKQELDSNKTRIINLRAGKLNFLGYDIFLPRNMKLVKYKKRNGVQTVRRSTPTLRFHLPQKNLVKRLKERGYITYSHNRPRPISKSSYSPLEDHVIVQHFASVWLGIRNFYAGCTNHSQLQYVHYLLHMSCAMTLAHRHRSSSKKIFQKHGKRLEIKKEIEKEMKTIAFFPYQTNWKVSNRKWLRAKAFKDPFTIYANRVSRSRFNKACLICQTMTKVEMHHVKHVRKQGYRYKGFQAEMSLLNRKQVPLCKECHIAVHMGLHDGIKLSIDK